MKWKNDFFETFNYTFTKDSCLTDLMLSLPWPGRYLQQNQNLLLSSLKVHAALCVSGEWRQWRAQTGLNRQEIIFLAPNTFPPKYRVSWLQGNWGTEAVLDCPVSIVWAGWEGSLALETYTQRTSLEEPTPCLHLATRSYKSFDSQ